MPFIQRIGLTLLLACLVGPASAQTLKLATIAPDGSAWMEELRATAERIEAQTGGELSLRFYPGGVMGDAEAVLRRMRLGQLHGGAFTLGDLARVAPAANLYSMPFVFRNLEEVQAVRETFDPLIIEALGEGGMVVPGISLGGFAYLFSDRSLPVDGPEGIDRNLRVWVPVGDESSRRTLDRAGASPVPLPISEVYTALQTGAVNTFATTPSAAIILQWHTRARSMLDMPLLMTAGTIGIDQRALARLTEDHRSVLVAELRQALERLERSNLADNAEAREALEDQDIEFLQPEPGLVDHWHELAHDTRRSMQSEGVLELPHMDRLERRLESLRDEG
ncbi:C4-dicarboxylate ABC transporter [Wenzhouxiangella sp. XN201]|uniref:TRAP transporter substrate-binding protein DctP n=1 Tax=Wenzhouxiangella sp. XN201 TaxID=2710755 RepID=UPI0013C91307|nr:TRAP transporter substrate-binding protein DctP [Wenzhouxiangella sp. XN201]NEZ04005.1 C4-dicarboxylate ABC transporter [Wenzhouxiangella sp. XN201]